MFDNKQTIVMEMIGRGDIPESILSELLPDLGRRSESVRVGMLQDYASYCDDVIANASRAKEYFLSKVAAVENLSGRDQTDRM